MSVDSFKTKTGLELPIVYLKGKPYLQVAHRVAWFRSEKPEWTIRTEVVSTNDKMTIAKAEIINESGRLIADGYKQETAQHFGDHLEKALTGSIGRALALCGYGTQFAEIDFEEMPRIVDGPVDPVKPPKPDYAAAKTAIKQKEAPVIAPNPVLQLQEAAKVNAWTGEQMRTVMIAKMQKMLVKDLSQAQVIELCELMKTKTFTEVDAEMKGNVK